MADNLISTIEHNFFDLLEGKTDFNGMIAGDGAAIEARISKAAAPIQPFLQLAYQSFKEGASAAVGVGETALGKVLSNSSDSLATALLDMMQASGIPTNGVLTVAEHAALTALINGLKTMLDRAHILYSTPSTGIQSTGTASATNTGSPGGPTQTEPGQSS